MVGRKGEIKTLAVKTVIGSTDQSRLRCEAFNFRNLECFIVVADELHFRRAAQRLNVSEGSVSERIRMLEQDLGGALLQRSTRQVTLTPFGIEFLRRIRPPFEQTRSIYVSAKMEQRVEGDIVIGHTPALGRLLLPELVHRTTQVDDCSGKASWRPLVMHTHKQLHAVTEGRIDIGLCWAPKVNAPLKATVLSSCPLVAVLRSDDPLNSYRELRLADLQERPLTISAREDNLFIYGRILAGFLQMGLAPMALDEVADYEELTVYVATQRRIGLHPAVVALASQIPGVVFRVLADPTLSLEICAVRLDTKNPEVEAIVKILQRYACSAVDRLVDSMSLFQPG